MYVRASDGSLLAPNGRLHTVLLVLSGGCSVAVPVLAFRAIMLIHRGAVQPEVAASRVHCTTSFCRRFQDMSARPTQMRNTCEYCILTGLAQDATSQSRRSLLCRTACLYHLNPTSRQRTCTQAGPVFMSMSVQMHMEKYEDIGT